jgi:hypothetical protein
MDGTQLDQSPVNNAVFGFFSLLGAISAVIVGIAIFDTTPMRRDASRAPASAEVSNTELRMDLPVLD